MSELAPLLQRFFGMAMASIAIPSCIEPSGELQRKLDAYNKWRLSPALPTTVIAFREREIRVLEAREHRFVEGERAHVGARAATAPVDPEAFVAWFEALEVDGPGQHDPLFDWLETRASLEQMVWVLRQEVAGEAGFDDLVALTQVKMPVRVKLELARNYWDEMGQGCEGAMHGPMLSRLAEALGIGKPAGGAIGNPAVGAIGKPAAGHLGKSAAEPVESEALALGNLMVALAVHRRYAYQSIGALGVIELTAPGRAAKVNAGLKRLGVTGEARRYFALHATLDIKHSAAWNREVLRPLVASDARVAQPIAEGALMRLTAGARCFERYRRQFGL